MNIIVGTRQPIVRIVGIFFSDNSRTLSQDKMYFNSDNLDEYLAAFRQNFQTFCSTDPDIFPKGKDK